jgi:hypothetical protein
MDLVLLLTDPPVGQSKPQVTAAQKAWLESRALSETTLLHGAYYTGLLGDTTTAGRWHARKRRFIIWEQIMGQARLKAAPHVADVGTGPRFAPLSRLESEGGYHISDFAFETAR